MPANRDALSEELLESERYGHGKGTVTGKHAQKLEKFGSGDRGTMFLEKISDGQPNLKAKLLRFLQNRDFDRIGGNRTVTVNVPVIAATNRNRQQP